MSKFHVFLCCFIGVFLTACTVQHTKQTLTDAQQWVGLKSDHEIKRWRNIQFDRNKSVLIKHYNDTPAWNNYTDDIYRQAVIVCNRHFARCGSSLETADYVIEIKIQTLTLTEPKLDSAIPIQVKSLSWLATVKDANNQRVLDKLTVFVKKSVVHRETYNFSDLVKPSIEHLFQELSND